MVKLSCRSSERVTSCELAKKMGIQCVWTTEDCRIHLLHSMQLQGCLVLINLLQIVNREGSNFVLFLNRTAVLMDQSGSVAQPTPGTNSGTDSTTIPPVLTEQDIPGVALNAVNEFYSPR